MDTQADFYDWMTQTHPGTILTGPQNRWIASTLAGNNSPAPWFGGIASGKTFTVKLLSEFLGREIAEPRTVLLWPSQEASNPRSPTVLDEAAATVNGARSKTYGDVVENAEGWAAMFTAATGLDVKPHHYPIAMICAKLVRLRGRPDGWHRDSVVDIPGYALIIEMIHDAKETP